MKQLLNSISRWQEYKALAYRLLLAYLFYFVARVLFYFYNADIIAVGSTWEFFRLYYHGLAFDSTAILYANALFVLCSILPLTVNTRPAYQKFLFGLYFACNLPVYAANFVDFIYYRFNFGRCTSTLTDSISHESNKMLLFFSFLGRYWHVFLLFFLCSFLWIRLYRKFSVRPVGIGSKPKYFVTSFLGLVVIVTLCIGGIRGDFKKSTRPINLIDASRYVAQPSQADLVLNTPFAIMRTLGTNSFRKVHFVDQQAIDSLVVPIKRYRNHAFSKKNVVVFILESNAKEYYGSFNQDMNIPDYEGYTPFVDSLAQHSLIFTNAYSNGYKSIHAMSSVLAGIPSFKDAFTSSPYPKQTTESLVSTLEREGYHSSFFHGAPNGSMGFLGYANILGIDRYYGKDEYHHDADFDGVWGIWDGPFFQYFETELGKQQQPFLATLFSVSSHEPYKVPPECEGKFPEGHVNIHQCIGYTDFALRQFFKKAKTRPWFKNTLFVMVGDHGNTVYYDAYKKEMNKNTVMMLLYDPQEKYKGVCRELAQQIDLYPTILDIMGYPKPFRSWGRSLVGEQKVPPFALRFSAQQYQLMSGNYVVTFDGKKATGFFATSDKDLEHNLIGHRNTEMNLLETRCKAFVQDYMARVMDRRLGGLSNKN